MDNNWEMTSGFWWLLVWVGVARATPFAVLAMATGYRWPDFSHFVGTLRAVYNDTILLGVSHTVKLDGPTPNDRSVASYLRDMGVQADPVELTDCTAHQERCQIRLGDESVVASVSMLRYHMYRKWLYDLPLQGEDGLPTLALLIDFRDVFFQTHPFASLARHRLSYDLGVSAEHWPNKAIAHCPFNRWWVESCYGTDMLRQLADQVVLCSGSTWGTVDALRRYVDAMIREWESARCTGKGIDQGLHNVLIHDHRLDRSVRVRIFLQGSGPVHTIGAMHPRNRHHYRGNLTQWGLRDAQGYVLNWDRSRSAVVHQGDRFGQELVDHIHYLMSKGRAP